MRRMPVSIELYSIHRGENNFEGIPVDCFSKWNLLKLFWLLPWNVLKNPQLMVETLNPLFRRQPSSFQNIAETLLGLAFALIYENHFRKNPPDLFHGVWATMPASAAMLLSKLTGIPFTMGAHAYDVYRHRGDWLLPEKIRAASLIHTTTEATQKTLITHGAHPDRCIVISRGLFHFPSMNAPQPISTPLRLISIGRLVEKKGYFEQFEIYAYLRDKGLDFKATIIGGGYLKEQLTRRIEDLELTKHVTLLGSLPIEKTLEHLCQSDIMLFTGKIANDGDRDGLPNVIPEAMACGIPVITTPVAGVPEAIYNNRTGLIVTLRNHEGWYEAITHLRDNPSLRSSIRNHAREWVENNFDAKNNARQLAEHLRAICFNHP